MRGATWWQVDAHPSRQETRTYQSVERLVVSELEEGSMEEVDGKLIEVVRQVRKKESSPALRLDALRATVETQQSIDNK